MSNPFLGKLREAPAPSPLDPAQQNDYREQSVTVEQANRTWHEAEVPAGSPIKPDRNVEVGWDEWAPITYPVGSLDTSPHRIIGDDPYRRAVTLTNIGTEDLAIATDRDKFHDLAASVSTTSYLLKAGATVVLHSTREIYVRAPTGTAAGITCIVERGARVQA